MRPGSSSAGATTNIWPLEDGGPIISACIFSKTSLKPQMVTRKGLT